MGMGMGVRTNDKLVRDHGWVYVPTEKSPLLFVRDARYTYSTDADTDTDTDVSSGVGTSRRW